MSWDLFSELGDLFSASNVAKAAVAAVPAVISTVGTISANNKAAQVAREGQAAQAAAIKAGNDAAQERLAQLQEQGAPGVSYLRSVVASDGSLTPLQQENLGELRRTTANQLATGGLRGAGRAQVAALRKTEDTFVNQALDQNRSRAISAAGQLAGQSATGLSSAAGIDQATGAATGQAAANAAETTANADIANASNRGRALGDITSIIASDNKGRESRYRSRLSNAGLGGGPAAVSPYDYAGMGG